MSDYRDDKYARAGTWEDVYPHVADLVERMSLEQSEHGVGDWGLPASLRAACGPCEILEQYATEWFGRYASDVDGYWEFGRESFHFDCYGLEYADVCFGWFPTVTL